MRTFRPADEPSRRRVVEPVDPAPFLGHWVNTARGSSGIVEARIVARSDAPHDALFVALRWSAEAGSAFIERPAACFRQEDADLAIGLSADFDLGVMRCRLAANVKLGVLVIAAYSAFTDGRTPTYAREFYARAEGSRGI